VQHLPATAQPGRITKGAANHLLSEVYISLKQWDKAIAAASALITNPQYKLMQQNERFGKYRIVPVQIYSGTFSGKATSIVL
jgi:hypothetical protein